MGSMASPNFKCWQLRSPYSQNSPRSINSSPLRNVTGRNSATPYRLLYGIPFSGFRNLRVQRLKGACSSHFDDFHNEEMMNLIQEAARKLNLPKEDDHENGKDIAFAVPENGQNRKLKNFTESGPSEQTWTSKPDFLEPPSWPEREEIPRLSFERKVNCVGIPLSIRMIKKKLQLEKGFKCRSELTHCSVKKTFSSMLFIIHELQNCAFQMKERLHCEDLQDFKGKLQRESDASFLWLFQHVFWKTPNLMVCVMVLIAKFSVFSVISNIAKSKQQHSRVDVHNDEDECRNDLEEGEEMLWNSMVEEACILQNELRTEILDHETMPRFVAPVSVELEGDHQYEEYVQTELYYKKHLRLVPYNSLLLSNYAQFLYLVVHDLDGAEEYFKRSVLVEQPEAEAYSRYADFLWLVRKDLWAAEMRYQQALEADPGNSYISSKYTNFLWSTGGDDTGSPLEFLDNFQL